MNWTSRLPRGARLSPEGFAARHEVLTWVLWLHVGFLVLWAVISTVVGSSDDPGGRGATAGHSMGAGAQVAPWIRLSLPLIPAVLGLLARAGTSSRTSAQLTSLGLIATSFVGITLSGGQITAHLHLFTILVFVALYQMWTPLAWTVIAVVLHHTILGLTAPDQVFDMQMSAGAGLLMAAVHTALVILEVLAILVFWHFAEIAEAEAETISKAAEEARILGLQERRSETEAEAERERRRHTEQSVLSSKISVEVAAAHANAGEVATAVTLIGEQVAGLSQAVQDIAARTQTAATMSRDGQVAVELAGGQMSQLGESIAEIAAVNELIAKIAGQTNLLALNATIEASRAGAAGKGFEVVAHEVKQMANDTASSVDRVAAIVAAAIEGAGNVATSFTSTTAVVTDMSDLQVEIAGSVEEQSVTLARVVEELNTVSAASTAIFTALERLNAAVDVEVS